VRRLRRQLCALRGRGAPRRDLRTVVPSARADPVGHNAFCLRDQRAPLARTPAAGRSLAGPAERRHRR